MTKSIFFFMSLFILSSTPTSTSYGGGESCFEEGSDSVDISVCVERKNKSVELDKSRALRVAFSKLTEDSSIAFVKRDLERSEEAWLSYRNSHCAIKSSLKVEGVDQNIELLRCKISLTKLRADELRTLVPNEDTCGCTSHSLDKIQFKTPIPQSVE